MGLEGIALTAADKAGAAARRFGETSNELADSIIVRGKATPLAEQPVEATPDNAPPSLYERTFELTDIVVIRGNPALFERVYSLKFKGYTMLSPAQRSDDTRNPTLHLDGYAFFNRKLSIPPKDVVLIVGGPEAGPTKGLMGRTASVVNGVFGGSAVRAFLAEGADRALLESLPLLVGFHGQPTLASAKAATQASHPVVGLDALRQAARQGTGDQVEVLARWFLHPSQPACVKTAVIELLGEAINEVALKTGTADALVEVAVAAWEAERADPLYAAYLRTLHAAAGHTSNSELRRRLEGLATDSLFRELSALADALLAKVKKDTPS